TIPWSRRTTRWRARNWRRRWGWDSSSGSGNSAASGGLGERLFRIGTDTLDHRAQAVGALRRQVFAQTEFIEYRERIGGQNFLGRTAGIERERDRNEPAHDMGVAVAAISQHRRAVVAIDPLGQPDLADASLHLVRGRMFRLRHWFQHAAEFDDVPVPVVPLVQ